MAYEPTIWKNREVERPRTFQEQSNPDGTITLIPKEGNIIEAGTPIIADTMNKMELGIKQAHDDLANLDLSELATKQELNTHLAERATLTEVGHVQLSNSVTSTSNALAATPSAVKQAMDKANEAFLLGNSTKEQLVDTLLSLDPSLPISYSSTWQEILTATGQISTGKKLLSGTATVSNTTLPFVDATFTTRNMHFIEVSGIGFLPGMIQIEYARVGNISEFFTADYRSVPFGDTTDVKITTNHYLQSAADLTYLFRLTGNATVANGSFRLPVTEINMGGQVFRWRAVEA